MKKIILVSLTAITLSTVAVQAQAACQLKTAWGEPNQSYMVAVMNASIKYERLKRAMQNNGYYPLQTAQSCENLGEYGKQCRKSSNFCQLNIQGFTIRPQG